MNASQEGMNMYNEPNDLINFHILLLSDGRAFNPAFERGRSGQVELLFQHICAFSLRLRGS